jgi:stage V sporulation protein D (sporulation-specific penicillin-binding protein)
MAKVMTDAKRAKNKADDKRANRMILGRTIFLLVLCGIVIFIPLVARLYKIQIIDHDFYEQKAINQQTRDTMIPPNRGTIYDRSYKPLVISASVETVYLAPVYIESDEEARLIADGLSRILGLDYEEVLKKTGNRKSYYQVVIRKIEKDLADKVREFKQEHKLSAIQIEPDTKRYYTYGNFASQVIGFVGVDNNGLEGIEAYYDETLTGKPGKIITAKNAKGTSMDFKYEKHFDSEDGLGIVLTIDETMQHIVEKHLEQAVIDNHVENRGAAIIMDVNTGEILAMAVTGGADLNDAWAVSEEDAKLLEGLEGEEYVKKLAELQLEQWRNKAVADTYEPGSIFKLITAAIALEEDIIDLDWNYTCHGSVKVAGWSKPISCWRKSGHGTQIFVRALQNSCNPAFVTVGLKIGQETYYRYMRAFGFGQPTEIDLPGEAAGLLHDYKTFVSNDVSLAVSSFGQTFTVTPIQMITAVSAIVNGGYLIKPHIVKEFIDSDGKVTKTVEPEVVRQVISEETSATMRYLMEQVVHDGSGRNAQVKGYDIGGKTATSEKIIAGQDTYGKYVVSFVAVAPANEPQIALLVLLDTPTGDTPVNLRSGGYMAAPLAGRILADILPYMGIEPHYTGEELFGSDVIIPRLEGLTVAQAEELLGKKNLKFRIIGEGDKITGQLPASGAKVTSSAEIILYMGEQVPEDLVTVPNVLKMSPENANRAITNAGLYIRPTGAIESNVSGITAASQSVEPGIKVKRGTVIDVEFRDTDVTDLAN